MNRPIVSSRPNGEAYRALAKMLEKCPEVKKHDQDNEREAYTMAHSLLDLENSFKTFLEQYLPRLKNINLSPSETYNLLLDMGEEYRHILYHIRDQKFYRYLFETENNSNQKHDHDIRKSED